MSEFVPQCNNSGARCAEDPDLLCVEVSVLGATAAAASSSAGPLPAKGISPLLCSSGCGWQTPPLAGSETTQEEFLRALLVKTDAYRPRQESLACMENKDFLNMRKAVVNWFANVSVSYGFANETVVAALSNFDRYVAVTLEPVTNHLLLQLAAYVALLVASKMSEVSPLRMKSLANLTGRMFTPIQVQKCELDMISKLQFRLAPPSADETLHCLATLVHNLWPVTVPLADIISVASCYLKKARARTCWFRHSPYTLAVAALATAFNNLGLGQRKRRLLRECDARARSITGRGVDFHGVAACAAAMSGDERAAAAAAAAARAVRGSTESPVCGKAAKEGWGSPTGVAQGAELLQEAAFSTVGGAVPLVEDLAPSSRTAALPSPQAFSPRMHAPRRVARGAAPVARPPLPAAAAPIAARACSSAVRKRRLSAPASVGGGFPETEGLGSRAPGAETGSRRTVQKRGLHQSYGSCFVPCARRQCLEGSAGRRVSVGAYADSGHATTTGAQSQGKVGRVDEGRGDGSSNTCASYQDA